LQQLTEEIEEDISVKPPTNGMQRTANRAGAAEP
jgi:hypothetical protein